MRQCGQCGSDISHRAAPQAKFCEDPDCRRARGRVHSRESWQRVGDGQRAKRRAQYADRPKPVRPQRTCAQCGIDITHRDPRAKWCHLRCRDIARHAANPSRARHRAAVRRGVPGNGLTGDQWAAMVRRFRGACAYCEVRPERLTQDHVVPISRGGHDTEGNIVPACRPCNLEKADRFVSEWRLGRRGKRPKARRATPSDIDGHEYPQDASSENLVSTTPFTG